MVTISRSALEMIGARLSSSGSRTFEEMTLRSYGRTLAEQFLLSYSRKLWGVPCSQLSPRVSGGRLKGLNVLSVLADFVLGRTRSVEHMDGSFYYPRHGIGEISDALAHACDERIIQMGARLARVRHEGGRVTEVETGSGHRIEVDRVVSTIPLTVLIGLLTPSVTAELARDAQRLRFRNLRLVVIRLARQSVTASATVYVPDPAVPYTRVFEPRNRSVHMAPSGHTSLAVEIPCFETDAVWAEPEMSVVSRTIDALVAQGWFRRGEVIDARALQVPRAYPLLDLEGERAAERLRVYLGRFENLKLGGRSGRFEYVWIHDLIRMGRATVERMP
jgi:protoporphyrinogen oxidase